MKAEGTFVALLQFVASHHNIGGVARGEQMKVAAGRIAQLQMGGGRKHKFAAQKAIKQSPTARVRKKGYFWNPVHRKTFYIHDRSWTTSQRTIIANLCLLT